MPASPKFGSHLFQLGPQPLPHRVPSEREPTRSRPAAAMRQAEEVERLWLTLSAPLAPFGCVPPELNQACLFRVQFQPKFLQSLLEFPKKLLSLRLALESNNEVVCPAHDDHLAARLLLPPLLDPQVERIMEIQIGQ